MSRFKFRVWSKDDKEWVKGMVLQGDGKLAWDDCCGVCPVTELADTFVVQQFTGFLDKEGREIYEGDIIKESYDRVLGFLADFEKETTDITDGKWIYGDFHYISKVIWCDQYHAFLVERVDQNGEKESARKFPLNTEHVELLGNMFDNPELLK